jgi:hypothetical protein
MVDPVQTAEAPEPSGGAFTFEIDDHELLAGSYRRDPAPAKASTSLPVQTALLGNVALRLEIHVDVCVVGSYWNPWEPLKQLV